MSDKTTGLTAETLSKKYLDEKMSASEIAKEYGCDPKKITRMLTKYGIPVRGKEEARLLHIEKHGHPRKGVTLSEDTKTKISESQSTNWTAERKSSQGKKISEKWKNKEYDPGILSKAAAGLRLAAINGSKIEKIIVKALEERGMKCITQAETIYENLNMKCDIWIISPSEYSCVVEADGPCHTSPIFGQDRLEKQILSDQEKNALLLSKGLKVLRFRVWVKHMSKRHERKLVEEFFKALEMVKKYGGVQTWDYGKDEE